MPAQLLFTPLIFLFGRHVGGGAMAVSVRHALDWYVFLLGVGATPKMISSGVGVSPLSPREEVMEYSGSE